jgi:hypothetical protein
MSHNVLNHGAVEHSKQDTVWRRDEEVVGFGPLLEPVSHLCGMNVRPERAGSDVHQVSRERVAVLLSLGLAEPAQEDAVLIDDWEDGVLAELAEQVPDAVVRSAARHCSVHEITGPCDIGIGAPERQAIGAPLGEAAGELKDAESFKLEPRRGPGAKVSLGIRAVRDDRPATVELFNEVRAKILDRDVNGTLDMELLVLVRREGVDQLSAFFDQLLQTLDIDCWYTRHLASTSARSSS